MLIHTEVCWDRKYSRDQSTTAENNIKAWADHEALGRALEPCVMYPKLNHRATFDSRVRFLLSRHLTLDTRYSELG